MLCLFFSWWLIIGQYFASFVGGCIFPVKSYTVVAVDISLIVFKRGLRVSVFIFDVFVASTSLLVLLGVHSWDEYIDEIIAGAGGLCLSSIKFTGHMS